MSNFTPVSSLLGGLLIGLAAAMLWLANGRIGGISGIVGNLPTARSDDVAWRITFLAGLIVAPKSFVLSGAPAVVQAGQVFSATVTAMNGAATPAATPNFGPVSYTHLTLPTILLV